jgi:acetamidase/formamidase
MIHELPLRRRTLHGHFSRDLEPILAVESGDTIAFACPNAGWETSPTEQFAPRDERLDAGHALIGPVEVRGARKGHVLEVRIDAIRPGAFGFTAAGDRMLRWTLDPGAGVAWDDSGREVRLRPFLGVLGMPPDEPGIWSTGPPRACGGNIDCKELVAGTTLLLPVPVDGALFSAGDGHGRQGDGEVSGTAIECPIDRAELTLALRGDLELRAPAAWTEQAWLTFGFDEDLDAAAEAAVGGMLDLMRRELDLDRDDALALASVVVDLRVTQVVNGVKGVHAVLAHDAIGPTTMAGR